MSLPFPPAAVVVVDVVVAFAALSAVPIVALASAVPVVALAVVVLSVPAAVRGAFAARAGPAAEPQATAPVAIVYRPRCCCCVFRAVAGRGGLVPAAAASSAAVAVAAAAVANVDLAAALFGLGRGHTDKPLICSNALKYEVPVVCPAPTHVKP